MGVLTKLPLEERPRERLISLGEDALSLTELLAICLGSGRRGTSALRLAEELLGEFGSLSELLEASAWQLMKVKGIGPAKATLLKATFALVKRLRRGAGSAKYPLNLPKDAYVLIAPYLEGKKQEKIALLLRNVRGELFHHEIVCSGTLCEVMAHPREIFHHLLLHCAHSFILVHNHPSGDPEPSRGDLSLTRAIQQIGRCMNIALDDHLIIGKGTFVSLWERGFFGRSTY